MFIKLFKNQQPLVFIILPVAILLVWLISDFNYFMVAADNGMPLYTLAISMVKGWPSWLIAVFCALLISSQCLHLNWILNKYEVLYKSSYLPALIFFLFSAFLPQFVIFHPMLFVNSIMLFVLERILRLYKNDSPLSLDFDSCLLIGIASLFYFPALIFSVLFFISLTILKPFSWRDWIVGAMGLVLPYFFLFVIYFMNGNLTMLLNTLISTPISDRIEVKNLVPTGYSVTVGIISCLLIVTLWKLRNNFYKNDIKTRNYQQVIIIFIVTALACALATKEDMLYKLTILIIPLSVVVANYFLTIKKNWLAETVFLILLATVFFNYSISF
jgi:hypothetical protein